MRKTAFPPCSAAALALAACTSAPPAPPPVSAPAPAAAPVYQMSDIAGARGSALDTLLGAPALVRREGAGEFRRYSLRNCALLVILYPDENGEPSAAHVEAAALRAGEPKPDPAACLAAG